MNTRNSVIVLTRFLPMVFIILCHIIYYYEFIPGNMALVQVFNVGVYIFLIISGYLYGGKFISNFKNWILKRWSKIVIPVIILVIIDIMLLLLAGETIKPISFFFYALNIQGLSTISNNIFSKLNLSIANLGTLWFTTIIMVCYCLVPILQKQIKEKCIQYQSIIIFAISLNLLSYISLLSKYKFNISSVFCCN